MSARFVFRYTEFPAVGNLNTAGSLNNAGTNGYYWSSAQSSSDNAHNMNFNSSSVGMNSNNNKRNGFSVRCVRQEFTTLIFLMHKGSLI